MSSLDYFQPLGFGSTYERVFKIFQERWIIFTAIAFAWYVLGWIFAILLNLVLGNDIRIDGFSSSYIAAADVQVDENGNAGMNTAVSGDEIAFYLLKVALYYVFTCVAHGASIWVVAHWYLNQSPRLEEAFHTAAGKCWPLVGATLLLSLIVMIPLIIPTVIIVLLFVYQHIDSLEATVILTILSVAWGMFVSIVTYTVYAAVMVEGAGPWESIRRTYSLTKGHWRSIFAVLLSWGIIKFLLSLIISTCDMMGLVSYLSSGHHALIWFANVLDTIIGIFVLAIGPV